MMYSSKSKFCVPGFLQAPLISKWLLLSFCLTASSVFAQEIPIYATTDEHPPDPQILSFPSTATGVTLDSATVIGTGFDDTEGLAFSPDRKTLFMSTYGGGEVYSFSAYATNVTPSTATLLASGFGHLSSIALSPDGQTVFITDLGGDQAQVYSFPSTATGVTLANARQVTSFSPTQGPDSLSTSPDGQTLFMSLTEEGLAFYISFPSSVSNGTLETATLIMSGLENTEVGGIVTDGQTLFMAVGSTIRACPISASEPIQIKS